MVNQPEGQLGVADLDGDGLEDILVVIFLQNQNNKSFVWYRNLGGSFLGPISILPTQRLLHFVSGDIDAGGSPDIGYPSMNDLILLSNDGQGGFAPA